MTIGAMRIRGPAQGEAMERAAVRVMEVGAAGAAPAPREGAQPAVLVRHMLTAYLAPVPGEGAPIAEPRGLCAGLTLIQDLREAPAPEMKRPFHAVDVLIPWDVFDDLAAQVSAVPIAGLDAPRGAGIADPVVEHLVGALLPALRLEPEDRRHYVDLLGRALANHLAQAYGGLRPGAARVRGGLAPHVLRRAQAALKADLKDPPPLPALARLCGLSSRHFARAFRDSTGMTPHQWTMRARVQAAKAMMAEGGERLAEIALACGFADQSHLTRVFKREAGVAPAAWRRTRAAAAPAPGPAVAPRAPQPACL